MAWRRILRLLGILVLVLAFYFMVPVSADARGGPVARGILAFLVLAVLITGMVLQLRMHVLDVDRRIDGLVIAVLITMTVFALAFYVLELRRPDEIAELETRVDSLYFTLSTMLTVGFGDVHAKGQIARVMVLIQMVFNTVFVATAAALMTTRIRRVAAERSAATPGIAPAAGDEVL